MCRWSHLHISDFTRFFSVYSALGWCRWNTFAISSAYTYSMNRPIWRTRQQAGAQKPGHFILSYHGLGWAFKISLTLSMKRALVLQLIIVKCYHSCVCNWDTYPCRVDGNSHIIFLSTETGDVLRLLLSLSRNLGSYKPMQTFVACLPAFNSYSLIINLKGKINIFF